MGNLLWPYMGRKSLLPVEEPSDPSDGTRVTVHSRYLWRIGHGKHHKPSPGSSLPSGSRMELDGYFCKKYSNCRSEIFSPRQQVLPERFLAPAVQGSNALMSGEKWRNVPLQDTEVLE